MNKWLVGSLFFMLLYLMGCSNDKITGEKPPAVFIEIGSERYETTLGSYCWGDNGRATCVDTAGPIELLEGKEPIQVKPGEEVTVMMDYKPKPTEAQLGQVIGEQETAVTLENNHFVAPMEKGIYYYSYGVWWMDEKEANVSHGDAFYAFALKVN